MNRRQIELISSAFCNTAEKYKTYDHTGKSPEYMRYGHAIGGLYKANKIAPRVYQDHLARGEAYITAATEYALRDGIPLEQIRAAFSLAFGVPAP